MDKNFDFDDEVAPVVVPAEEQVKPLSLILQRAQIDEPSQVALKSHFGDFLIKALDVQVRSQNVRNPEVARKNRLEMRRIRIDAENLKKELKEKSLRYGKALDALFNVINGIAEPLETKLFDIESAEERKAAQARAERIAAYKTALEKYEVNTSILNLEEMDDTAFQRLLADSLAAYNARKAEEKARIEREEAANKVKAAELENTRLENERLRLENEKKTKEAADAAEKARRDQEALTSQLAAANKALQARPVPSAPAPTAQKPLSEFASDIEKLEALRLEIAAIKTPTLKNPSINLSMENVDETLHELHETIKGYINRLRSK